MEILLIIGGSVVMSRIASAQNESSLMWGAITFGACIASLAIPLPGLRVLIVMVAVFIGLMVKNMRGGSS